MTNNKQQTAVEWLETQIRDLIPNDIGSQLKFKNKIKQAKEIEWDQINNAYLQGFNDNDCNPHKDTFNLYYYKQTYGGGEQ